jgi:hypothetical protein
LDKEGAEETALVQHFDVEGADAEAILAFDDDKDDDENVEEEISFEDLRNASPEVYKAFQASVRVQAATRAEGNRRKGGIVTQKAVVRAWLVRIYLDSISEELYSLLQQEFIEKFMATGAIRDAIVDDHSLLLFIKYSAERPKRNRRKVDMPGMFVGAVS